MAEKPIPKLTKKQKGFADDYLDSGNGSQSAKKNYNITTDGSARAVASRTLTKANVQEYLASKADDAASMVYFLSQKSKQDFIKLNASKDILDRAGFRAVEKSVNVNVDFTPDADFLKLAQAFEEKLKGDQHESSPTS